MSNSLFVDFSKFTILVFEVFKGVMASVSAGDR